MVHVKIIEIKTLAKYGELRLVRGSGIGRSGDYGLPPKLDMCDVIDEDIAIIKNLGKYGGERVEIQRYTCCSRRNSDR